MSFFTNGATVYAEETLEQLMNNDKIQPSFYENYIEGALAIVAESTVNDNRLMEAIGINEAAYFAQTGEEYVYTEGTLSDIWGKIKSFIMKIWEKIKGLFKRFVAMFDKYFASDKDFVKKYKKRILMADAKDISYDGYKFPGLAGATDLMQKGQAEATKESDKKEKAALIKNEDEVNDIMDAIRAQMCGSSSGVSANEFSTELKEKIYGDKENMEGSELEVSKQISYIENYAEQKKVVEKAKKAVDKFFKDAIKLIDDKEKEFTKPKDFSGDATGTDPVTGATGKNSDIVKHIGFVRTILTRTSEATSTACGIILQALKDRNRQARAICVKVMSKGGTLQKESTSFEYPAYGSSFLENVKFI